MTAFVIADIPTNIVTIEQLNAWTTMCLAELFPAVDAVEGVNAAFRAAQSGVFYIAATNEYRHVGRTSLKIQNAHLTGALKSWMYAEQLGTTALTPAMKSN